MPLEDLGRISLRGLSQQEVVADYMAQHCGFFAPRAADGVAGLSVVGCDGDHKDQEGAFPPTSVWLVQYETVMVWVCHKALRCDLCKQRESVFF